MATPAHPSFGHLTPEEYAAVKAAATRAAKKGRA